MQSECSAVMSRCLTSFWVVVGNSHKLHTGSTLGSHPGGFEPRIFRASVRSSGHLSWNHSANRCITTQVKPVHLFSCRALIQPQKKGKCIFEVVIQTTMPMNHLLPFKWGLTQWLHQPAVGCKWTFVSAPFHVRKPVWPRLVCCSNWLAVVRLAAPEGLVRAHTAKGVWRSMLQVVLNLAVVMPLEVWVIGCRITLDSTLSNFFFFLFLL